MFVSPCNFTTAASTAAAAAAPSGSSILSVAHLLRTVRIVTTLQQRLDALCRAPTTPFTIIITVTKELRK